MPRRKTLLTCKQTAAVRAAQRPPSLQAFSVGQEKVWEFPTPLPRFRGSLVGGQHSPVPRVCALALHTVHRPTTQGEHRARRITDSWQEMRRILQCSKQVQCSCMGQRMSRGAGVVGEHGSRCRGWDVTTTGPACLVLLSPGKTLVEELEGGEVVSGPCTHELQQQRVQPFGEAGPGHGFEPQRTILLELRDGSYLVWVTWSGGKQEWTTHGEPSTSAGRRTAVVAPRSRGEPRNDEGKQTRGAHGERKEGAGGGGWRRWPSWAPRTHLQGLDAPHFLGRWAQVLRGREWWCLWQARLVSTAISSSVGGGPFWLRSRSRRR